MLPGRHVRPQVSLDDDEQVAEHRGKGFPAAEIERVEERLFRKQA